MAEMRLLCTNLSIDLMNDYGKIVSNRKRIVQIKVLYTVSSDKGYQINKGILKGVFNFMEEGACYA